MDFISLGENVAGFVQHYEDTINDGVHTVTYTGIELKGLAERRIVIPASGEAYQHYYNKEPEYIIAELLDKQIINPTDTSRRIYGKIAPYTSYHSGITYDGRYQVLSEEIIELATAYDIGWCASIEDSAIVWKVWNGIDRTAGQTENNRMMLDYGYGTMNNSTLTVENTVPTYMIVAGQGEGAERAIEELNNGATGLNRIETFLDARDIEDDTLLPQRGQEKLAEYGDNSSYTATLSNQAIQQYRTEFDLGDIGTVRDEKLDGSLDYRITSIEEVYEEHQIMINVVFGYDKNTLKDSIQRMNSKRDALLAVESYSGGGSSGGGGCDCDPITTSVDSNGNVLIGGGCVVTGTGGTDVDLSKYATKEDIAAITPSSIGAAEKTHSHSLDTAAILNAFFPIGSAYVTNTNKAPSFGGTWTLTNKQYAYKYLTSGFVSFNTDNVTAGSTYAVIQGDCINLRIDFKPLTAWDDSSVEIGTIDYAAIGISSGGNVTEHALALSDGGQGYAYVTLHPSTGVLTCIDTMGVDGSDTILANQTYILHLKLNIQETQKDSAFCDRFYWKRTA